MSSQILLDGRTRPVERFLLVIGIHGAQSIMRRISAEANYFSNKMRRYNVATLRRRVCTKIRSVERAIHSGFSCSRRSSSTNAVDAQICIVVGCPHGFSSPSATVGIARETQAFRRATGAENRLFPAENGGKARPICLRTPPQSVGGRRNGRRGFSR